MAAGKPEKPVAWTARQWHRLRRHSRLSICAVIFAAIAIGLSLGGVHPGRSVLFGFDIGTVAFLGSTLVLFLRSDTSSIRGRARKEDEGYWGFLIGSAAVATIALVALAVELHGSKNSGSLEIALAVASVILAWLFLNTIFALHYAHEYYGDHGTKHSGIDVPGDRDPDYWDFMYFAFVIGMTFQVSDIAIGERTIRRVVLAHSVIAFFFNVIVIAVSVNIVAGGGG